MDDTLLQVNLCPSNNIGKASCSVILKDRAKTESEAVVNINHTIASVCPLNGLITVITEPVTTEPVVIHDEPPSVPLDKNHCSFDVGNKLNKRRNKLWLQDDMSKAINAVRNGMHVRAAAKQFSVPRTTLKYKLCSAEKTNIMESNHPCTLKTDGLKKDNLTMNTASSSPTVVINSTSTNPFLTTQSHQDIIKIPFIDKCLTLQDDGELLKTLSSIKLKKRKCKLWSEETMKQAVEAVIKGSKIKDASILYGVPHSTLGNRVLAARRKLDPDIKDKGVDDGSKCNSQSEVNIDKLYPPILPAPPKHKHKIPNINLSTNQSTSSIPANQSTSSIPAAKDHRQDTASKPRGKIKQWTEESMMKALEALDNDGLSIHAAARKYNIPKSTLDVKRRKRNFIDSSFVGPQSIGRLQDEYALVCYINVCAMFGITNIKSVVLLLAAESAERQGLWSIKEQGLPPDSWWDDFCLRRTNHIKNVDITSRQPVRLTNVKVSLFFDKLSAVINSSQYHKSPLSCLDQRTFTVQEKKFEMDVVNSWVNGTTSLPETSINSNNVSTVCCVNASGTSLPPMCIVFVEDETSDQVTCNDAHFFVCNINNKSRDSDYYFTWFKKVFLRYAPQIRPLILLLDPDTSFITPEFISLANKNQIILLCLPPLSAQFIQPLNVTVYPALEQGFKTTSVQNNFVHGVHCCSFPLCFKTAWDSSVNESIIKTGFEKTGIYPLNRKVFDHLSLPAV